MRGVYRRGVRLTPVTEATSSRCRDLSCCCLRTARTALSTAEHRARRRAVEAHVDSRDRLYRSLRDQFGKDDADEYFGGGAA